MPSDERPTYPATPLARRSSLPEVRPIVAAPAREGLALDTNAPLTASTIAQVRAGGYQAIFRYGPLPSAVAGGARPPYDLSAAELALIVGAGLQCGLIQHPRSPANNNLTLHEPELDARTIVAWAQSIGYPTGAHICLDLEGLYGTSGELRAANSKAIVTEWATRWQAVVIEAGYRALLYVGYDVPLEALDLYMLPGFDSYWRGMGGREPAVRGAAIRQGDEALIGGVKFDVDEIKTDARGGLPQLAQAA